MSQSNELVISHQNEPIVALGMTGASFDSAQRAGVISIEADTDAMQYIAREVGFVAPSEKLPPLVMMARDSSDTRDWIGRWDDRLPVDQSSPKTGRFFTAGFLDSESPPSGNFETFVRYAKEIGASALTEVSVPSWTNTASHAADFAAGLLLGQRPLDLPPKPSLLSFGKSALTEAFGGGKKDLDKVNALRKGNNLPLPFLITRKPGTNVLEARKQIDQ